MNADVNPGVCDHRADPVKYGRKLTKWLGEKEGRSKNIDRMGGRKRVGSIAVGQQANTLEDAAGADPPYPPLEEMAGKLVGDSQGKPDKDQKDEPLFSLPDQDPYPQGKENVGEILEVSHKRHEPVEKGILPSLINELEENNIYGLKKGSHTPLRRNPSAGKLSPEDHCRIQEMIFETCSGI